MRRIGGHNQVHYRPWTTEINSQNLMTEFNNATKNGRRINNTSELAGIAGRMISPSGVAGDNVPISNDWSTPRYRWVMIVETGTHFRGSQSVVLTGYTSHCDGWDEDRLDPNMEFMVNNSIMTSTVEHDMSGVMRRESRVVDAAHVIVPPPMPMGYYDNHGINLITPQDVFGELTSGAFSGEDDLVDLRNGFADEQVRRSRRSNSLSTSFLASSYNAVVAAELEAKANHDVMGLRDEVGLLARARCAVKELPATKDPFLYWLETETQFNIHRSITLAELQSYYPEIDNIIEVIRPRGRILQQDMQGEWGEYLNGATADAVAATTLAYAIPAIMMDVMLQDITFDYTNMTRNGQPYVEVKKVFSFAEGIDLEPYVDHFLNRLEQEVMNDLTNYNQIGITMSVRVNITGDTSITISIDGSPDYYYLLPSFADANFSPVVTHDVGYLKRTASDLGALFGFNPDHFASGVKSEQSIRMAPEYNPLRPRGKSII